MFLPILLSPTSSLMIARPEKALSKRVQASVSLGTSLKRQRVKRQRVNLEHRIKKRGLNGGDVQAGSCELKGARGRRRARVQLEKPVSENLGEVARIEESKRCRRVVDAERKVRVELCTL